VTTTQSLLERVLQFLAERQWTRIDQTDRFFIYVPPRQDDGSGFRLFVPRDPNAIDFARSIENCIGAIASFYDAPLNSIEALLLPAAEVISVGLSGEGFGGGAAPFPQFERVIEHLKRAIAGTATFVLTDDPIAQSTPMAARDFLDDCWFLQTARGSFVTRVALPTSGDLRYRYSLFSKPQSRELVGSTLRRITALVGERVLRRDPAVFSVDGYGSIRDAVSVNVLEQISGLLKHSEADEVDLSFNRRGNEQRIAITDITHRRLQLLDEFIEFARVQSRATFDIDVEGQVVEVKRGRRDNRSSFVGLMALVENRVQTVSFKVEPGALPVFLDHFRSGLPIRVRGRARQLRTQIRIESGFQYQERA
jgi:hypothetical protein